MVAGDSPATTQGYKPPKSGIGSIPYLMWAQKITSLKETIRHAKNLPAFPVGSADARFHPSQRAEHSCCTDDFLGRLATDAKEGRFLVGLSNDSKTRVRQHVVDFLCVATGGPCKYTGRDMETAHNGLNITEEDWTIAVKALGDTLNKFKVPAREQGEVVSAIASLKSKIVGR